MIRKMRLVLVSLLVGAVLFAEEIVPGGLVPKPWFTGSIVAPPGEVVPLGNFSIQPYVFSTVSYGMYNAHWHPHSISSFTSINTQCLAWVGLAPWMDFYLYPEFQANFSKGESAVGFGDLPLGFDFQLLKPNATWFPGIKLSVGETFPTGKYQHLSSSKAGTDAIGEGLYSTQIALVLYKVFHLQRIYYLSSILNVVYQVAPSVHLHGFNSYGGGFGTDGTMRVGNILTAIYAVELTLTKNWAFALDAVYIHTNRNHFSGNFGVDASGKPAHIDEASSDQLSFCPALEYNFSESLGIIGGGWFTACGRNAEQFASAVISLTYVY